MTAARHPGGSQLTMPAGHADPGTFVPLLVVALLGWVFLAWAALDMTNPLARLMMPMRADWGVTEAAAVFVMWAVMMAAMMLPSALPMALVFAALARRGGDGARVRLWAFVGAYVLVWSAFSTAGTAAQWGLQAAGLISPMRVASADPYLTGALLLAAGAFQFTPLKHACLTRCRSPLGFLMTEWRPGLKGALAMGLRHGAYCTGCCWALMALLFVFGVMNLLWVALLAALVAVEKLAPRGEVVARLLGAGMLATGAWRLATTGWWLS
jgi:predicted metal-binding membrane protein